MAAAHGSHVETLFQVKATLKQPNLSLPCTRTISAGHIASCRANIRYSYRIIFCSSRRAQVRTFMNVLKSAPRSQRADVRPKHLSYTPSPQKTDCCKSLYTRISHSTVRSRELDLTQNRSKFDNLLLSRASYKEPNQRPKTGGAAPHRPSTPTP